MVSNRNLLFHIFRCQLLVSREFVSLKNTNRIASDGNSKPPRLVCLGQWVGHAREGHGVQTWPDGASYTGQWVKDLGRSGEAVKRKNIGE